MKIDEVRKKLKKNKTIFFTFKKLTDSDYKSNWKYYLSQKNLKSRDTVRKELSMIENYWKCDPMHYFRYRLFEKDLSYEELIDYIPSYFFYNYYMPSLYNNFNIPLTESKIKLSEFFLIRDIPTPFTTAMIRDGVISNSAGDKMKFIDLKEKLNFSPSSFIKPDTGKGGKGIIKFERRKGGFYTNGKLLDETSFMNIIKNKSFIVQEGISQRDDIASIYPGSVNTLRVITQFRNGEFVISAVVLRIGRNGSFVDNSAMGGMSVNIDIEKGIFNKFAYTEHTNERFESHPDTGFVFDEFIVRDWRDIKYSILDSARKAPEFPEVAWDIAILETGISVIEINLNYGIDHLQCCIGGMRRKLNVLPSKVENREYTFANH